MHSNTKSTLWVCVLRSIAKDRRAWESLLFLQRSGQTVQVFLHSLWSFSFLETSVMWTLHRNMFFFSGVLVFNTSAWLCFFFFFILLHYYYNDPIFCWRLDIIFQRFLSSSTWELVQQIDFDSLPKKLQTSNFFSSLHTCDVGTAAAPSSPRFLSFSSAVAQGW